MRITETAPTDRLWDPFDPDFRADPYPYYDRLRREAPAYRSYRNQVVLTRYSDVFATLRSNGVSRDVEANAILDESDPIAVRRRNRRRGGAKTILNLDPPDHTRLRRLVSKAFTPSAIERLRPRIEQMVDEALDRAADRGSTELIDELAFPVPFRVISELLDMPTDRADELRDWSQALTVGLEPAATIDDLDRAEAAVMQLIPYLIGIIEQRRTDLGDDLLSGLLAVEDDGDTLSPEELISFVVLLYVAGHETTVNLIGNGTLALLRNPDQLERWRRDASLDATAVDELLRYDGPVQHTVRVAMQPLTLRGGRRRGGRGRAGSDRADGARSGQSRSGRVRLTTSASAGSTERRQAHRVLGRRALLPRGLARETRGAGRDHPPDPPIRQDRTRR